MTTQTHLSDIRMDSLELHDKLKTALEVRGFTHCTPIQAETLPLALTGENVAGQAQTGTGKTAAFLLAAMHRLLTTPEKEDRSPNQPRVLILAPTRELAVQIEKDARDLVDQTGLRLALAFGGTGYEEQRQTIENGVDILVGTPGRLIDYFKQKVFDLKQIEVAVLDEADRMFDLGFIKDIRYLLRRMPPVDQRLNLLFSATLSHRVLELAYEHMGEPKLVRIEPEKVTADRVRQVLYHVANSDKIALLLHMLSQHKPERALVFINTKRQADRVERYLNANGHTAGILSGDVPQNKRLRLLTRFQDGDLPIMVATDVAARGLHIPEVSHVYNYDLPQDAEDYVHRIGRTARAGAEGDAVSLCCETYVYSLPEIESYIGHRIPTEHYDPDDLPELIHPPKPPPRKGGGRHRNSGGNSGGGRRRRRN